MASDEQALILQMSADISKMQKQLDKAVRIVNDSSSTMEHRSKKAAKQIEDDFGNINVGKSLQKVFDSSKLSIMEEGAAKLRVFGSALEPLGPLGITTAAGIFAVAVAAEGVKKAMEEVGALKIESDKTGVPVEALQELQYAAKESHVPVEALNGALLNLNDTLGRLRSGVGAARLQKLADQLGLTPADLQGVKTANDLLPILADHIKALPSLSEQYAAAAKAGVAEILPLLLKGGDGVRELRAEYKALGVEVSGTVADQIERGNLAMERAHDIAHDKLRNSLLDLSPILVGLSTAWDEFAAHAIDALTRTNAAYQNFVKNATERANQNTGNGFADLGANLLGRFNLAISRPGTTLAAVLGNRQAQNEFLHGPAYAQPAAAGGGASEPGGSAAANAPSGPTPAMLAAELEAKKKLDEIEARFVTHTTSRLEAERAIEEINAKRAAAGDKPLDKATSDKILAAASAQDAKHNHHATRADPTDAQDAAAQQAYDAALRATYQAQQKLAASIRGRADLQLKVLDQERDAKLDELTRKEAEIHGKVNDRHAAKQRELIEQAKDEVRNTYLAEREAVLRQATVDEIAQQAAQLRSAAEFRAAGLDAQQQHYTALADLALTTEARNAFERQALEASQARERALIDAQADEALSHLAIATANGKTADIINAMNEVLGAFQAQDNLRGQQADQRAAQGRAQESPIKKFEDSVQDFATTAQTAGVQAMDSLATGLADAALNAKSLGDVAKNVFRQMVADLLAAAIKKDIEAPILAAFGFADGGPVFGPGTSKSDSIPAMLSSGEYVVNAAATQRHRALLDAINGGRMPHFANGGPVMPSFSAISALQSMSIPQAASSVVIMQPFHFHAEGAVLTHELLAQANAHADRSAARAGQYARAASRQDAQRANYAGNLNG